MSVPSPPLHSPAARPGLSTLARLAGRFRPRAARTAGVLGLLLVRGGLEAAWPLLVAAAIDRLLGHEGGGGGLPPGYAALLVVLGATALVRNALVFVSQVAAARLGQDLENALRSDLLGHVLALRFRYHDVNRSGATIARGLRDMEKARHFFREVWFGWAEVAILLLTVVPAVFVEHWTYGLATAVAFGLGTASAMLVGRRVAHLDRDVSDVYDDVATTLQENVAGARVVRAFGREGHQVRKFGVHMDRFSGHWASEERYWTGRMPLVHHVYHLVLPVVLLLGAARVATGHGGVGEVTAVLLFVRMVHHRVRPLTRLVILGQQAVASASRVFEVLDHDDVIPVPTAPRRLPPTGGDLALEDVRFRRGTDGEEILRGVSLVVPAGSSLGILGPTGSGKSSLVHLLPRFYDPTGGTVRLDGIDLSDLDVRQVRREVGLVFQEPFLFSGTVAENIAYGRPDLDRAAVVRAAELAAADEFVRELPDGYDTLVGERGVSLSGGQCQRLTIARAVAMDPRVLVFDDATASVDAVTERVLFQGIRAAARGRTTLVISQRVTSVRWCDRIALLEEGRVTALGSHDELLREEGLYREIFRHQQLERVAT